MTILRVIAAVVLTAAVADGLRAQEEPRFPDETKDVTSDWIQIYSSEWFKGKLHGMFDGELDIDSVELDRKTFDWYKVKVVRTANVMEVGLRDGTVLIGKLYVDERKARIVGAETKEIPRFEILSIAPAGDSTHFVSFRRWSGKIGSGITVLAGNVDETDVNVNSNLQYRTPRDRVDLDYVANISNNNNVSIANNQRFDGKWDRFLTSKFFVKPVNVEWYADPFQNIDSRTTAGVGAGYQILSKGPLEWEVSGGVGYQRTQYVNVEAGQNAAPHTWALGGHTKFKQEWTRVLEFTYEYNFNFTNLESGRYNHHMYALVENKWSKLLDLDITLVWDRTQHPQPDNTGHVPKPDDFRMVVSLGIDF